jgi:hypothetical protein
MACLVDFHYVVWRAVKLHRRRAAERIWFGFCRQCSGSVGSSLSLLLSLKTFPAKSFINSLLVIRVSDFLRFYFSSYFSSFLFVLLWYIFIFLCVILLCPAFPLPTLPLPLIFRSLFLALQFLFIFPLAFVNISIIFTTFYPQKAAQPSTVQCFYSCSLCLSLNPVLLSLCLSLSLSLLATTLLYCHFVPHIYW